MVILRKDRGMKNKVVIIITLVLVFSAACAEADVRPNELSFKTK
jgi:hypothetical protein